MKKPLQEFFESGILERYLLGETDLKENHKVDKYLALYPEVRQRYDRLQDNLETFASLHAMKAPDGLKASIMKEISAKGRQRPFFMRYAVAASIAAMIFASISIFLYNQNKDLKATNDQVAQQIESLEQDMKVQLEDLRNQYIVLNNPNTRKFPVKGNKRAKELKAVAYVNPVKKLSYINMNNVPELPENQCFQMWAEVNGKMVNLGVIKHIENQEQLLALPYNEEAVGYITIEENGGSHTPNVKNIVANIPIIGD